MKRTCVYLSMENPEGFYVYDHLTYDPLDKLGWDVVEIPWTKTSTNWGQYDAVVIRWTWDYQHHPQRFLATLEEIENSGTPLFNPLSICRWNLDKTYLRDLSHRGVPIVPTHWAEKLEPNDLQSILSTSDPSSKWIVKPTIGAGADGIVSCCLDQPNELDRAVVQYRDKPCMIQPFLNSILSIGEYSLFYFAGRYSHAILKKPKSGDFRVQEEFGGCISATQPDTQLIQAAETALAAIEETLLYARIDLVLLDDGTPAVIELELIEPSLYFPYDDQSPERFVRALDELWN